MPPTAAQNQAIQQFVDFTSASSRQAASYMKKFGYDVDRAADAYFQATGMAPPAGSTKVDQSLAAIFEAFRDKEDDDKDVMGMKGMLNYLDQIGVDPNTAELFIPLEIVQATAFGELNKEPFIKGWKNEGSASYPLDTLFNHKLHIAKQKQMMASDKAIFKRVYRYTFISSKEKGQKALPLANAIIYWQLLFSKDPPGRPWETKSTNWLELWIEYLEKKWTKSVNKDMWNQTLEFYLKTMDDESMSFWSEDSAWPGVIDDFVAYVKERRGSEKMETD